MTSQFSLKKDFPIFVTRPDLVYLDNAATSLTPSCVLKAMDDYYSSCRGTVTRGVYQISEEATSQYESVRERTAVFLNTKPEQIIFMPGTTHGLNMIASGLRDDIKPHHTIITTALNHHAHFVPWQRLVDPDHFFVCPLTDTLGIDEDFLLTHIDENTFLVALPLISNVTGGRIDAPSLTRKIKDINPRTLIVLDAAQAMLNESVTPEDYSCDFLCFSGHKMYGPTGIGVLWGKTEALSLLEPFVVGGDMITEVTTTHTTYRALPHRLEPGTPNISGVIGLGAAIDYIGNLDLSQLHNHKHGLIAYCFDELQNAFGDDITIFSDPGNITSILSFALKGIHPHDLAGYLDTHNICVRAGNHCAQPLHYEFLGIPATTRISVGAYTTRADIDFFINKTKEARMLYQKPTV